MELSEAATLQLRAEVDREIARRRKVIAASAIPERHILDEVGAWIPFHSGQDLAWDSEARFTFVLAGSQGGKTSFGPRWLLREIQRRGRGDYLAATATYDLFKLKMLPAMRSLFEDKLGIARYWSGAKVLEICDPSTLRFYAEDQNEPMWARIILRSAQSEGGLESSTAKAAWLDECVAPETLIETEYGRLPIALIVSARLPVRVWSHDVRSGAWELRGIRRWIRLPQHRPLRRLGLVRLTGSHKVWTRRGYQTADDLYARCYTSGYEEQVLGMRMVPPNPEGTWPEAILQSGLFPEIPGGATWGTGEALGSTEGLLCGPCTSEGDVYPPEGPLVEPGGTPLGQSWRGVDEPSGGSTRDQKGAYSTRSALAQGGQWSAQLVASRETSEGARVGERVCCCDGRRLAAACLQDRRGGNLAQDSHRGRKQGQRSEAGMVCASWMDLSPLLEPHGGDMDGRLSSDGYVYNLEIEHNHNYVANGLLIANCGMDEFGLASWEAVQRRLSIHLGRVLGTTTLYNRGWLKTEVHSRWLAGDETYNIVQFSSIINPAFPKEEYDRVVATMPRWKVNMFYRGEFDVPENLIYGCFDVDTHTCEPFGIPEDWALYMGIDFGGVHMAAVLIAERPQDQHLFVVKEYLAGGKTTSVHADELKQWKAKRVWGGAPSEDQWRREFGACGMPIIQPPIKEVEVAIDVVFGEIAGNNITVFKSCSRWLDEIGTYSREDKDGQPTEKIANKETFHLMDATRYVLSAIRRRKVQAKVVRLE